MKGPVQLTTRLPSTEPATKPCQEIIEDRIMRSTKIYLAAFCFLAIASAALAVVFGTVRGIIHDQQHRPMPNIQATLKAKTSALTMTTQSDTNGEFHFDAVPLGEYQVTVADPAFAAQIQDVTVLSGSAPVLHFELHLATQNQSVTVSATDSGPAQAESVTPTTLVNREEIADTREPPEPTASR